MRLQSNRTAETTTAEKRSAFLLILTCSFVYLPFILNKDLYWDDWSYFWTFWVDGPSKLLQYYREAIHVGHFFPVALLFGIGGGYAGVLAKAFALVCHITNAILLYRIFHQIRLTADISVWIAAFYVLSPFYYGRGVLVTSVADFYLVCYLSSIWLLFFGRRLAYVAALFLFVLSLGFESFIFLEPLRVLLVYETRTDFNRTVRTCGPFWVIAVAFALLRLLLWQPYGSAAGYNQFQLDFYLMTKVLASTALFYVRAVWFNVSSAVELVAWYGLAGGAVVCLLLAWFLTSRGRAGTLHGSDTFDVTMKRLLLGLALAALGAVPYLMIGRSPHPSSFYSRFALVSVPGVLICVVSLIASLPGSFARTYILMVVFMISGLSYTSANGTCTNRW